MYMGAKGEVRLNDNPSPYTIICVIAVIVSILQMSKVRLIEVRGPA